MTSVLGARTAGVLDRGQVPAAAVGDTGDTVQKPKSRPRPTPPETGPPGLRRRVASGAGPSSPAGVTLPSPCRKAPRCAAASPAEHRPASSHPRACLRRGDEEGDAPIPVSPGLPAPAQAGDPGSRCLRFFRMKKPGPGSSPGRRTDSMPHTPSSQRKLGPRAAGCHLPLHPPPRARPGAPLSLSSVQK